MMKKILLIIILFCIAGYAQYDKPGYAGSGSAYLKKGAAGFWLNDTTANFLLGTQTGADSGVTGFIYHGSNGSLRLGGTSGLYWDNTTKRLGIGTTTPNVHLEFASTQGNTNAYDWILFNNLQTGYGDWKISKSSTNDLAFSRGVLGGSPFNYSMVLAYDGNIGIGALVPASKLHVIGDITYKVGGSDWGVTDSAIVMTHSSGSPVLKFYATDGDEANISISTTDQISFNSAGGGYRFNDGDIILRSTGRVDWSSGNAYITEVAAAGNYGMEFYVYQPSKATTTRRMKIDGDTNHVVIDSMLTVRSQFLSIDSLFSYTTKTKIDSATIISLPAGVAGFGTVMIGDNQEYSQFRFTSAGVVTLINNSTNVSNTAFNANTLNIYDAGSGVVIQNYLAAGQLTVAVKVEYYAP